jgi:ketosteroid isomerase-like protein
MIARGKEKIKKAFIAIANHFNNSIIPTQGEILF